MLKVIYILTKHVWRSVGNRAVANHSLHLTAQPLQMTDFVVSQKLTHSPVIQTSKKDFSWFKQTILEKIKIKYSYFLNINYFLGFLVFLLLQARKYRTKHEILHSVLL